VRTTDEGWGLVDDPGGWLIDGDGFGEDEIFIEGQLCGAEVEHVSKDDYQR
jgi:hypothetical protein